ncbi:50S ribosomal protein L11 methyltransferase [Ectothiorhodospiraceae bacterium BW-2]|nr:50S ribosomal protein L11 methyltransferase [Ectothiorhodospiraceae bacterium BW-2]
MASWQQLTLLSHALEAELWEARLFELGALAVTLRDGKDEPLYEPPLGTTPLWQTTQVTALFEADAPLRAQLDQLALSLALPEYQIVPLADQVWERSWMEGFEPMRFGRRLWIVPSWHTPPPQPEAVNILLDPGIAFGTGTHATTRLCLEWLDSHAAELSAKHWIDFGCGSGILAIAAAKLGAGHIDAIDIDPQAVAATCRNRDDNGITPAQLVATCGERVPLGERVDGVIANILATPLIEFAPQLSAKIRPGGWLVLSGILSEQAETVASAYRSTIDLAPATELNGWVRIEGRRYLSN